MDTITANPLKPDTLELLPVSPVIPPPPDLLPIQTADHIQDQQHSHLHLILTTHSSIQGPLTTSGGP